MGVEWEWRPFLFRTMQPLSSCLLGETGFSAGTALVFQHRAQRQGACTHGVFQGYKWVFCNTLCGGLLTVWAPVLAGLQPLRVVAAQATRRERTQRRHQSIRNKVFTRAELLILLWFPLRIAASTSCKGMFLHTACPSLGSKPIPHGVSPVATGRGTYRETTVSRVQVQQPHICSGEHSARMRGLIATASGDNFASSQLAVLPLHLTSAS